MITLLVAATVALTPPADFDPEVNLLGNKVRDGVTMHQSRASSGFVRKLLANGTPEDIALATKILDAIISCQEMDEDDPNYGNYFWYLEDGKVTDRNGAAFVLSGLIPTMIEYGDRLPEAPRERVLASIRLGLGAIARINVTPMYTNIAVKDFCNTILGGELLGDDAIRARGAKGLMVWMALTDSNGIPVEYNSPTYSRVTIRALANLIRLVKDDDTRIRAQTALARLALSKALHIHPATGRMAGPHSRSYHPTVVGEVGPEAAYMVTWTEDGTLPSWIRDALDHQPDLLDINETPLKDYAATISTHMSLSFALGVATVEFPGGQSNVLIAHHDIPGNRRPGVVYTRYLTNDKWLGSFYHSTDRNTSRNLLDEGSFIGTQDRGWALGLYTRVLPRWGRQTPEDVTSARANIIWTARDRVDEIRIGSRRVEALPAVVPRGEVVVVASGKTLTAVRPLIRLPGADLPVRLAEKEGDLVLQLANYEGDAISAAELDALSGGRPLIGFYLEMAERSTFPKVADFARRVGSGQLAEELAMVNADSGMTRHWTATYTRGGRVLGIEIDVGGWKLIRRWTDAGDMGWPMLESLIARQNRSGKVEVGEASLTCGKEAAWLFAPPGTGRYVAAYHGVKPAPVTLTVPDGSVEIDAMGTGMIVWDNGKVTVEAVGLVGEPKVVGGTLLGD